MSNALAIAAVTKTLRQLLIQGIPDLPNQNVTAKPPDRAFPGGNATTDQINLFLYHTIVNAAWRNRDLPNQIKPGETSQQPLALNLHYLISTSGAGDDEILSHQWLGIAMSVLHDHAVLSREEIRTAIITADIRGESVNSDLHEQVERVRITPLPLGLEDLSKLWTTFTTPYRVSAAYEVSVVLIESTRPVLTPLPVLDRNLLIEPNLSPPFPTLTKIQIPNPQGAARCGDGSLNSGEIITLIGHHLDKTTRVRFQHPRRQEPLQLTPLTGSSATQIILRLPDNPDPETLAGEPLQDPNQWLVGVYKISVEVNRDRPQPDGTTITETVTTNELPLAIAPRLILPFNYNSVTRRLTLTCRPRVLPEQRVMLLIDNYQLISNHTIPTNTLEFTLPTTLAPGEYLIRLRVDGIDSLLVRGTPPKLEFDPNQKVSVP
ncbi:Pvc16 family protein [Nostoc sp. WHI]|uniref:Pvc16 family protein n=1 Tax=Nostoc sp. WHI TaxID=2650611 RepID=UPI0018C6230F|nr:Pvc16 family protein [Nostoc sp. WHI]MBG1267337.1 DUF4255 domain-containing protein [Nostoc sp. WHI]